MSNEGTVKSYNGGKGYGFITQDDGSDVFVHERDCGGAAPQAGDRVNFDIEESPSKPGTFVAKNVSGCTGIPEGKGGVKGGKGGGKQGSGKFESSVKSFSELKGWGFINHDGGDIFFHAKEMMDGSIPDRGDTVRYDVEDNPGKPGTLKAVNVTGGSKGKGQGKGKDMGGCGKAGDYGKGGYAAPDPYGGKDPYAKGGYGAAPRFDPWTGAPLGGGGGAWGGDAWGKGGDPWGYGGKGADPYGYAGKGKGGW